MLTSEEDAFAFICHKPHRYNLVPFEHQSFRIWLKITKKIPKALIYCKYPDIIEDLAPSVLARYGKLWFNLGKPGHLLKYAIMNIPSMIIQGSQIYSQPRPRGDVTISMIQYVRNKGYHPPDGFIQRELLISCLALEDYIEGIIETHLFENVDEEIRDSFDATDSLQTAYRQFLDVEGADYEIIADLFNQVIMRVRTNPTNFMGYDSPYRNEEINRCIAKWKP